MNMKERIARRLYYMDNPEGVCCPWENLRVTTGSIYEMYIKRAEGILDEMLNPTEGMLDSAHECTVSGCCLVSKEAANDVWDEMIQSAIEGK